MSLNDFSHTNALEANALFVLPEARSVMSPVSKTEPKRVPAQRLEITSIPKAMRSMGWTTSARLMERWLSTPAWTMPPVVKKPGFGERTLDTSHCDDTIVTMAWATRFERLQDAIATVQRTSCHGGGKSSSTLKSRVPRTSPNEFAPSRSAGGTYFANCSEARAAGAAPIRRGDAGYSSKLDRDGDGVACE